MRTSALFLVLLASSCAKTDEVTPIDEPSDEVELADPLDVDLDIEFDVSDDVETIAALVPGVTSHTYGTSVEGQSLVYYQLTPPNPNGKKAFLTFAMHGFEDAWKQDGRALYSIAHAAIDYYGANRDLLKGWTVYIVPAANPDGMRYGTNNWRESAGAYGRCQSQGKDLNRNVSSGTSKEQRALVALFDQVKPTIAIDFHGWYNTYYGDSKIGGFFQRSFNAAVSVRTTAPGSHLARDRRAVIAARATSARRARAAAARPPSPHAALSMPPAVDWADRGSESVA